MLDPFAFPETTVRLLVMDREVVLRPRTSGEVDRAALTGRALGPGWVIVEDSAPSFPLTADGAEQRKAWWKALEDAVDHLDEMVNPVIRPVTVDEWAEMFAVLRTGNVETA